MGPRLEGAFQFFLSLCMSIVIGTPQATFSSVQHFMLKERLYEDLCKVSSLGKTTPIYCLESRAAYLNVYNGAGLGFSIALFPAYYGVRYFGPATINVCCGLIYAAGIVFISDRPEDLWVNDRYAYGYALMSAAAPFALLNSFRGITTLTDSRFARLSLLCVLLSLVNLGPFIMMIFARQLKSGFTVHDMFTNLLWMPVIWVLASVLLMPLSDTTEPFTCESLMRYLKTQFILGKRSVASKTSFGIALNSPDGDSVSCQLATDPSEYNHKSTYLRTTFSGPFVALLLTYFTHSLPLDLIYAGGEARAAFHEELSVWPEITIVSPLVAAVTFPIIFWMTSRHGIVRLSGMTCSLVILQTALKFWSIKASWLLSSFLVGTTHTALAWTCALCFIKCVRVELISSTSATFFGIIAIMRFIAFPTFDIAIEFDTLLHGLDPYLLTLAAQLLAAILLAFVLRNEYRREQRFVLENEARLAFDENP